MNRLPALFPLLLVFIFAGASLWLQHIVSSEKPANLGNDRHDPDGIVDNLNLQRFAATGELQVTVKALRGLHFPDDESVELNKVEVHFRDAAQSMDWSADHAQLNDDARIVELTGNVVGTKHGLPGSLPQTLKTERLTILSEDEIARTTAPLVVTQGKSRVDAVGGEWNNIEGMLNLQRVRAQIDNTQK